MANYSYSHDLRYNTGATGTITRNVSTGDTITLTINSNYGLEEKQLSNCYVRSVSGNGGSNTSTLIYTLAFTKSGPYKIGLLNNYYGQKKLLFVEGTASGATQEMVTDDAAYGLQVWDANGDLRVDYSKRTPRFYTFVTGTGNNNTTITEYVDGWENQNNSTLQQYFAVNLYPTSNYSVDGGYTNGFILSRADVRTTNNSYQIFAGSEEYSVLVIKS